MTPKARILVVIGDPALDDVPQPERAALRARFTTIVRYAISAWEITDIYHCAQESGPERWLSEFMLAMVATTNCKERAFPKGRFEFGPMRNNKMVAAIQQQLDDGARALVLYFKGSFNGTETTEDLKRKCGSIKLRVIELSWIPPQETKSQDGPAKPVREETRDQTA